MSSVTSLAFTDEDWRNLQRLEFRKIAENYDPEYFGNSLVVLVNAELLVRFLRDRGQVFAEVASPSNPDHWFDLSRVLDLVGVPTPAPLQKDDGQELHRRVTTFIDNYQQISAHMGPTRYPETKRVLG